MPRLLPALVLLVAWGGDDAAQLRDVTWYRDVEPVALERCGTCHHAEGVGVGDWTDPVQAQASANAMRAAVEAGEMSLPSSDPEWRDYHGATRMTLTEAERQLFSDWAEAGAPLGDEADRGADLGVPPTTLADTDVTLGGTSTSSAASPTCTCSARGSRRC